MKPVHTKEFNAGHAKAGAPYRCQNATEATIAKWNRRSDTHPLGGYVGPTDDAAAWTLKGNWHNDRHPGHAYDLVMVPLDFVEGKPVWVGDVLVNQEGDEFTVEPDDIDMACNHCTWPKPARVYPQTLMTDQETRDAMGNSGPSEQNRRFIANAAIRHAIDHSQVITKADHEAALSKMLQASAETALANQAARDLAVAEAVISACHAQVNFNIRGRVNIAALIAGVK